jgi:hypothetical protein
MRALLILAEILMIVGCYWQPPDPPVLEIEYAGLFVSTVRNETTGSTLVCFGCEQQVIDTGEAFLGQEIAEVTASVEKGSFGEYVDLGTLTATLGSQVDVAPMGDPCANLHWTP